MSTQETKTVRDTFYEHSKKCINREPSKFDLLFLHLTVESILRPNDDVSSLPNNKKTENSFGLKHQDLGLY